TSRDDRLDVPLAKSSFSTSATDRPRSAASRAIPQPVMPPPMTSTSNRRAASGARRCGRSEWACIDTKVSQFPRMPSLGGAGRRGAIVAGVRPPFARAGTPLKHLSAIELGKLAVAELIQRADLDPAVVEAIVYGTVVQSVIAPNIAREISLLPI